LGLVSIKGTYNTNKIKAQITEGHRAEQLCVGGLEELVEAELAQALQRVADERGRPALGQRARALLGHGEAEAVRDAAVLGRVHLQPALDQVQRHDQRVRQPARQHAAQPAQRVVAARAVRAAALLVWASFWLSGQAQAHATPHPPFFATGAPASSHRARRATSSDSRPMINQHK